VHVLFKFNSLILQKVYSSEADSSAVARPLSATHRICSKLKLQSESFLESMNSSNCYLKFILKHKHSDKNLLTYKIYIADLFEDKIFEKSNDNY